MDLTDRRGRPWSDRRTVLNGSLWILRTGAQWAELPARYGNYKTVHRRFQNGREQGFLEDLLVKLAEDLRDRGQLDFEECFIDGTFVPAKQGGSRSERPGGAREQTSWQSSTAMVFLSEHTWPALRLTR